MRENFSSQVIMGLKKNENEISSEYYFYKDEYTLEAAIEKFDYDLSESICKFNYYGFTFELIPGTTKISELNICDTDKAYVVDGDKIIRKNLYYFYSNSQTREIILCLKNTIYPFSSQEISFLVKWTKYQDQE
jgi:hypothetical protein